MSCFTKTYIAAPIVGITPEQKEQIEKVANAVIANRLSEEVFMPWKIRIPNEWRMPLEQWSRCVFTQDVLALDASDYVVVCDYGRHSSCGTAWEAGYAFAKEKTVIVIIMPGVSEVSLMVFNGCFMAVSYEDFIAGNYTLETCYDVYDELMQN